MPSPNLDRLEANILRFIGEEGTVTTSELKQKMQVDRPATAKHHARKLCDRGFVRETKVARDPTTGRQPPNEFDVTDQGRLVLTEFDDQLPGDGFEQLTERRIERLEKAVEKLKNRVERLENGEPDPWAEFEHG